MSMSVEVSRDILTCPNCGSHDAETVALDDFYLNASGMGSLTVDALCHDCVRYFTQSYELDCTFKKSWSF